MMAATVEIKLLEVLICSHNMAVIQYYQSMGEGYIRRFYTEKVLKC